MKRLRSLLLFVLLTFFLSACGSNGLYRISLVTDGEHVFDQNWSGDLIIIGGSASIPAGVILNGSVHIFSGNLKLDGKISGDISFLNGDLILGPTARIDGDLNLGGGSYHPSPNAVIEGQVNTGTGISLPDLPERSTLNLWDLLLRATINGTLLGLLAVALVQYAPKAVDRLGEAATRHSLMSGAVGLLVGVVGISLLVTMAYTFLLIPVTLLGIFILGLGVLYGWIGLGVSAGRFIVRFLKRPVKSSAAAFFGMLVFMLGLELLSLIPTIGSLLAIAIAVVGLGAVSLTRFGLRQFVPAELENLST